MYIPTVYVLFAAEFMLLLVALSLFLVYYIYRRRSAVPATDQADEDSENSYRGSSYIEYLEKELLRNEARTSQQINIEKDAGKEADSQDDAAADQQPQNKISHLLGARNRFLQVEKAAAEHSENEHAFWDSIQKGMKDVLETFRTVETEKVVVTEESVEHKKETVEKVFYIETQGKKIDGEVNRLKDIIYEQENTLSSLRKGLTQSEEHFPDESEELAALHAQLNGFERQLNDSRVCMEVLELENDRLQQEVHKLEASAAQVSAGDTAGDDTDRDTSSRVDVQQMKEVLDKQEKQIEELNLTIEDLKLDASQAEKLKTTINSFTRTSQEMMGCITILEEENEHLKEQLHDIEEHPEAQGIDASGNGDSEALQKKIRHLEEELIKKDVNYAKLQDEFSSMEKEYLAMYEAIHGDKG